MKRSKRPMVILAALHIFILLFYDYFLIKQPIVIPKQVVSLSGRIIDIKQKQDENGLRFSITVDQVQSPFKKLLLKLDSEGMKKKKTYSEKQGRLFHLGDYLKFRGKFEEFKPPSSIGSFNAKQYYRNEGYSGFVQVKDFVINPPSASERLLFILPDWLYGLRVKIAERFRVILGETQGGTLSAMILGDKSFLDEEIKDLYSDNAISHVLAISGLHISIVGALIYELCKKLKLSFQLSSFIPIIFLVLYGGLIGFPVSALRAITMMVLLFVSYLLKKSYDIPSALGFSSILILFLNHRYLYQAGFQLSFLAVLGIFYALKLTEKIFNPLKSKKLTKKEKLKNLILSSILSTVTINLFILPFQLWHFYELALNGILLNIVVIPLMSILVFMGILGGLSALISIFLGSFLLGSTDFILNLYTFLGSLMKLNRWNKIILGRPSIWGIVIYYLLIFFLLKVLWTMDRKEKILIIKDKIKIEDSFEVHRVKKIIIFFTLFLAIFLLNDRSRTEKIEKIEVGRGHCRVARMKKGSAYLVDCGSLSMKNIGKNVVIPYLKYYGIKKLEGIIITDFTEEKVNGIEEILESELKIEKAIIPDIYQHSESVLYKNMIYQFKNKGIKMLYLKDGKEVIDRNLKFKFKYNRERNERKLLTVIEKSKKK